MSAAARASSSSAASARPFFTTSCAASCITLPTREQRARAAGRVAGDAHLRRRRCAGGSTRRGMPSTPRRSARSVVSWPWPWLCDAACSTSDVPSASQRKLDLVVRRECRRRSPRCRWPCRGRAACRVPRDSLLRCSKPLPVAACERLVHAPPRSRRSRTRSRRRSCRETCRRDEVAPAELGRVHAELARRLVHQALERIRHRSAGRRRGRRPPAAVLVSTSRMRA